MKKNITQYIEDHADGWGVVISVLCLLHCLAIPLLLFFSPTLALYFEHEVIHLFILVLVIPLVLSSLSHLKTSEAHRYILFIGPIGILLIIGAMAVEFMAHHEPTLAGEIISSIGSILLVIFHWHNLKVRKKETTCCKTDTAH